MNQIDALAGLIRQALPGSSGVDAAVELVRRQLASIMPGLELQRADDLAAARAMVEKQFNGIEILRRYSLISKRPKWYFGPSPGDRYWPSLREYLVNEKHWTDEIKGIDDASSEVVSLLENPKKAQFSCRGLVVGYVQSGKTANMTAVISKAIDAGYNTVILLAGLTNKLRFQTQRRVVSDLVDRRPHDWQVLTSSEMNLDFRAPPHGGFLAHTDKAQVAIIKKNVSPLDQLKKAIRETPPVSLSKLRVLLIDDECDQASVNSAKNELSMTAINARIREIIGLLPAVSYVGYTATPFANVLINPYRPDGVELDDLYPRDFITALPRPSSYFGTQQLFGRTPADPANPLPEEEGLDMIREIPAEEQVQLQPNSQKDRHAFYPEMGEALQDSVLYFLACCAVRRARGDAKQHMTMLIHTSAYVSMHARVAALVEGWVHLNRRDIADPASTVGMRLARVWHDEENRLPETVTQAAPVPIDEIFLRLPEVLAALEFPVENGASDDRIDYTGKPKTYIVVGGSILARGLTLEGLMVSYFLRSANQYDTLLQMGRWFGYRGGYEDLPRLWMTEDLKRRFRSLATVEAEIREDIERYSKEERTPMEVAVRIRSLPGMAITAANRMRSARQCSISYWGTHHQTTRFDHLDSALLEKNWTAGADLVSSAERLGTRAQAGGTIRKVWKRVPRSTVLRFFNAYRAHGDQAELSSAFISGFLETKDPRLDFWNIGIVEAGETPAERPLGMAGQVSTVRRARLNGDGEPADIKALMSRQDVLFDVPGEPTDGSWAELKKSRPDNAPLLLLYPIGRVSEPRGWKEGSDKPDIPVRVPLNAAMDVLGYGVVFPGSEDEGGDFVSVELQPLSAEEVDAMAAEEQEMAEAAGVE